MAGAQCVLVHVGAGALLGAVRHGQRGRACLLLLLLAYASSTVAAGATTADARADPHTAGLTLSELASYN
eukprot:SAG11_NODE_1361_length_5112_cov_2.921404_3_plen_70_part_00